MIVVDTNIITYLLLPTSYTNSVESLYQADPEWAAPTLWRSEFRNVLALYLRKKIITLEQALQIQELAESMLAQNEYEINSSQVLTLVEKSNCSAYDCEFIALARQLNVQLVTQDKKLLREFPNNAVSVTNYLSSL